MSHVRADIAALLHDPAVKLRWDPERAPSGEWKVVSDIGNNVQD